MCNKFDRAKHVFYSEAFSEVIKDTIRFLNGTPVQPLPPSESFIGAGVYALYYIGTCPYYEVLYKHNRINFAEPIYVGKAVPRGWRQARAQDAKNELYERLRDHFRSISSTNNLTPSDFRCRFMILENTATDMIGTVEAALIRCYKPIWNTAIDGFGNHTPGEGRFQQAKSDWDVLHPGRSWAEKCTGISSSIHDIEQKVKDYFHNAEK